MRQFVLFVLLFVFSMTAPAAQEKAGGEPDADSPSFEIVASPRQQILHPTRPGLVRLRIVIKNANEEYWCPDVFVEWGDGDASGGGGDCDPFEEAAPEDIKRKTFRYSHHYRMYGPMEIRVRLMKGEEVISSRIADVHLLGN